MSSSSSSKFIDDDRFDGLYMNVTQTTRGIEPLLDTVFSFLRRKTDFFDGPQNQGSQVAVDKVNEVLQRHVELYRASQEKAKAAKPAKKKKTKVQPEEVIEMSADGGFDVSDDAPKKDMIETKKEEVKKEETKKADPVSTPKDSTTTTEKSIPETPATAGDEKDAPVTKDQRGPPPPGNGGTVQGKYSWTQTLSEVCVTIPVPEHTRGRDLTVTITKKHLKVGLRSHLPARWIIDAPLHRPVIVDDSFWTVEDGNRLVIHLQKVNAMEWWDCVVVGDAKINVQAIQPENSSLNDLDGEMRTTVEKMMYDQRQKALGRPTSDEEQKHALLKNFQLQHPELDFSNAKIS